jgi:cytochrome c biogenesis protein ResB
MSFRFLQRGTLLDRVWLFFSSVKLTIVLLIVLGAAMGYGTYVETALSNAAARVLVYRTWWFDSLIILLALNLFGCTLRRAPYKPHQAGWITTHIALLLIMAGSVITHRFGMQGQMVIMEGDSDNEFVLEQLDRSTWETVYNEQYLLPFEVKCLDFEQVLYPGSAMTRLFRSKVEVYENMQMVKEWDVILNHPLVHRGYKISQSSWINLDGGKQATVLGVSYDPGIPYLYVGGSILILGMFGIFFLKPYLIRKFPPKLMHRKRSLTDDTEMTAEMNDSDLKEVVS